MTTFYCGLNDKVYPTIKNLFDSDVISAWLILTNIIAPILATHNTFRNANVNLLGGLGNVKNALRYVLVCETIPPFCIVYIGQDIAIKNAYRNIYVRLHAGTHPKVLALKI